MAEPFFSSLKAKKIKEHIYRNRELAAADISDYIESFYNQRRRYSPLDGATTEEFEAALFRRRKEGLH